MNNTEFEIRYVRQDGISASVPLNVRPLVFGSANDSDVLLQSQFASRNHFQIQLDAGRVFVSDLKSRNGTFLNGRRLIPYTREEWHVGDTLSIPKLQFELIARGVPKSSTAPAVPEQFRLSADRSIITTAENVTLTLSYGGQQPQYPVTFEARTFEQGLEAIVDPPGAVINNQSTLQVRGQVRARKRFWLGGQYPVRFAAMTPKGLFDSTEVMVKLRPRYEALLLLLPLFLGCAGVMAFAAGLFPAVEATLVPPTATATNIPFATPFVAPSALPLPTETLIPTLPGCENQCSALGWQTYIVQSGDTLSSLASSVGQTASHVAEVNCLADVNRIVAGQSICFPQQPQHPDLTVAVVRTGIRDVGSPYPLFADFTVTVSNIGLGRASSPVHVVSINDGNIIGSVSGSGWTCSVAVNLSTIDCTHPGPVLSGGSLPGIVVAHNFGTNFTVQVSTNFETITTNNRATGSACNDPAPNQAGLPLHTCSDHELWRQRCLANPNNENTLHIPPATGACQEWRTLFG